MVWLWPCETREEVVCVQINAGHTSSRSALLQFGKGGGRLERGDGGACVWGEGGGGVYRWSPLGTKCPES